MNENILRAPQNRVIFMNNNRLYYNDKGIQTLDKSDFNGICIINTGSTIRIANNKIISVELVDEFLGEYPESRNFNAREASEFWGNMKENNPINFKKYYDEIQLIIQNDLIVNGRIYKRTYQVTRQDYYKTESIGDIPILGLRFHGKIFKFN